MSQNTSLDDLFSPKTVAVIGAKEEQGSVAKTLMQNLMSGGFPGKIYPVNPNHEEVFGLRCYPSVAAVPDRIDLAVVVTPAKIVPQVIQECVDASVKSAVIISAGFKELGPEGAALEKKILEHAKKGKIAMIGPNCLGIMNPIYGLNATFAKGFANRGNVAFLSQSGALCTAVLDQSFQDNLGFSAFVSVGSMIDVDWGELIEYFGNDPNTRSILLYMETIGNAHSFLGAAKRVAPKKPIIVIKPGRTSTAAKAASSHTGSLAGDDEVFEAALKRVGVLRVDTISQLFSMAEVLGKQPLPNGPKLGIITNAGGPAVLATDAAIQNGAEVPQLSDAMKQKLSRFLPDAWSHGNPIDLLGEAGPERYSQAIEHLAHSDEFDGLLVILTPQDMTDPKGTAESLIRYANEKKPILASWMGGGSVKSAVSQLNQANIPTFSYPDEAAWAFSEMRRYRKNLQALEEIASSLGDVAARKENGSKIWDKAIHEGRTLLTEQESKEFLKQYGIPVVETIFAKTIEEALDAAERIGYPVVLKLHSSTITHKTDVGGVRLNLSTEKEVAEAYQKIRSRVSESDFQGVTVQKMMKGEGYELILGSSVDPQFGPVILFGLGGTLVEILKDTALDLPPLGRLSAERLIKRTRIYEAFKGIRGREPINMERLIDILVNFSRMIIENPWVKECDMNPVLVTPDEVTALDARIILRGKEESLPPAALFNQYD